MSQSNLQSLSCIELTLSYVLSQSSQSKVSSSPEQFLVEYLKAAVLFLTALLIYKRFGQIKLQ